MILEDESTKMNKVCKHFKISCKLIPTYSKNGVSNTLEEAKDLVFYAKIHQLKEILIINVFIRKKN